LFEIGNISQVDREENRCQYRVNHQVQIRKGQNKDQCIKQETGQGIGDPHGFAVPAAQGFGTGNPGANIANRGVVRGFEHFMSHIECISGNQKAADCYNSKNKYHFLFS